MTETSPGLVDACTARVARVLRRRANTLERITRLPHVGADAEIRRLAKREIAAAFLDFADGLEKGAGRRTRMDDDDKVPIDYRALWLLANNALHDIANGKVELTPETIQKHWGKYLTSMDEVEGFPLLKKISH